MLTMIRERKCILCHTVYSSKKEMDEHMRSMLHHRELENLKGRDSNHECRVCKVMVVGLSAYAKHISSQLHKDNIEARDAEEGEEEKEEEYFDKELIQLIKQRNEQSRAGVNRETEGDDRKLQRPQDDEASYQDRDMSVSVSLYHHGGPLQRDWKWGDESFVYPRQGQFTHPTRKPNNTNRHLVSQRGQPRWHPSNAGMPPNWYPNYGNAGPAWHQNSGGGTSGRHRGGRGRNPNWSSGGMNIFSNWQSKNSGINWKPGPQNMNDWNLGRNRGENFMDASWFKNCSMHDKYTMERYSWQWQESGPVPFYPGLAKENGNFDCLLDFTSDQLPSDQLLNFVVCDQPESKTSKVNRKCTNPSREKMNRWTPYPSLKIVEQQPAFVENVAKSSEKPDLAYLSLSHLSPKRTDSETGKPKMKKSEENYPVPTNSKMAPNKSAPCKGPRENNSVTKPSHAEGKGSKMPSLKSPLLAVPDIKPSSQKRSPKNLLKQVQMLLSSSSGERQNQLGTLSLESKNSPSSNGSKTSNEYNKPNNSKGVKQMLGNKEDQNVVLEKTKEEIQYNSYLQNSYSSPCRGTETHGNKGLSADSPPLKMHETQIAKLENETHKDITGNKSTQSKVCSPCDLTEPKCTAAKKGNHVGELGDTERNYADFQMDSLESQSSNQHNGGIDSKASFEEGGDKDNTKSNYVPEEESYGDLSNQELQKDLAGQSSGPLLPELSKLGFPASLQRDLTWRTNLKNKTGSHLPEPNLNSARRIRNVSGHRKSETEKESGLKPTLRQIISVSRRNVNWEQVIQQVTKKKQELGKGLPRFGIEMVPLIQSEQEGLELDEEADLSNLEGFHWEGISASSPGTVRKRSLSESSVVVDKMASAYSFFSNQGTSKENEQKLLRPAAHTEDTTSGSPVPVEAVAHVKQESASLPSSPFMADKLDPERRLSLQTPPDVNTIAAFETEEAQGSPQLLESHDMLEGPGERYSVASALTAFNTLDAATDSSYTSGNEQNDSQGTGKKRRATGEGSSPEIPCLERKNKRRKIKGKKERSQVDQLLSISLKEEELSKSLQCVDGSLLQARAALQAAYLEVQQLLVLKHQISVEMGTLRSQRIQILQGLQESYDPSEGPHQLHASSEKRPSKPQPAHDLIANPGLLVPLLETAQPLPAQRPPVPLAAGLQVSSPPTFQTPGSLGATSVPHSSLQVKEEPASPKHGEESMNISEENTPRAEVQFQGGNTNQQSSLYPIISTAMSLSELIDFQKTDQDMQKALLEKGKNRLSGQSSVHGALLLLSAKAEENKTPADNTISEQCSSSIQNHPSPPQPCVNKAPKQTAKQPVQMVVSSLVSTDNKRKKKKKKLKKKKALRAAAQVPENSDTEQDVGDAKPFRKVKTIKLPKAGKVTTSTPLKQEDAAQEGKQKKEENESDTSLEFVEVPRSPLEVVAIVTSSESGDEKPDSPSKREAFGTSEQLLKEASWSGYDEVSSTSEMGTNYRDGTARNVAETQTSISSIRGSKNSSEASSEPGEDEEPTEGVFESHSGSVNGIQIFGNLLYTCSGDKTIRAYNLVNRKCVGVFEGHTSKVNCLLVIQTTGKNAALYSGSSDHTINCYNIKTRELVDQFKLDDRVLCLHSRWKILYAGLANGTVVTFNIKNNRQLDTFECHAPRAISCLATSQEGARGLLIVGSYDCTISVRDARNGLLLRTLEGHSKTVLCMKVVNDLVFSGSSDQSVHAHNIHTGELVRIYKGHNHAVTVVNILGKVMVTACLDKCVRVYELQSHDRLQVYGGHSDMIMCMAIHKSMIYTGCYDGSIQCVRLNLMQNYRCWWHGCSLIFGVMDHMKQHLLNDHTNPTFLTLKCRWKNCDAFFTSRKSSKQDAVEHIEKHAEADSKIDS